MQIKPSSVVPFLFLWFVCQYPLIGYAQKGSFKYEAFINMLNSRHLRTQMAGFSYFNTFVKEEERVHILVEVWDGVANEPFSDTVHLSIATYLLSYPQQNELWIEPMVIRLLSLAAHEHPTARQVCLNTLSKRVDIPQIKAVLLKFLEDEDPFIRELALTHIFRWKDAKALLTNFANDYKEDESFSQSVAKATFLLERLK